MSEWKEYTIDQIASVQNGYTFKSNEYVPFFEDALEVLKMGHIEKGGGLRKSPKKNFVPRSEKLKKWILNKDDIVMAMTDMKDNVVILGVPALIDKNNHYVLNQRVARIVADNHIVDCNFLFNYLKWEEFLFALQSKASSGVQVNLSIETIKKSVLLLPSIEEQKAIASVLSSLDDKIDLLHRQNTALESIAETLFRQWFVEEAQEDWDDVQITKLFDVRDGTHDSPKQKTMGKPLITSKHINGNRLDFKSAYLISDDDFDKINQRSKVDKHDILISMIGTIGLIYLEQSDELNYAIKNVGLFKTSQNQNWMAYTYFWLKSHLGKQFLDEHISGSTQEYVSLGSFRSITFKKPPIEKLEEFNKIANGYLYKIKNNNSQIQTLEKLRDNLLPKLMSGEVRIQDD